VVDGKAFGFYPTLLFYYFTLLAFNTSGPISAQRKMAKYGIRGSFFINSESFLPKRTGSRSIVESRPPSVCSCTILMISSYVYTALNTKSADLVESHHGEEPTKNSCSSAWGKLQRATSDAYQRNLGLLLIIGSQMFLSLVNVAVKKLNDIDPPISALEVRKLMRFLRIQELDSFTKS